MGSVLLTSSAFFRALFLALCAVWLLPDLALAKHAGITRHYKFNLKPHIYSPFCSKTKQSLHCIKKKTKSFKPTENSKARFLSSPNTTQRNQKQSMEPIQP
ncbi:hypothetical protein QQP08_016717 [Theobroma cacao]|nr:hypothetical protein QQP08_016717 [Theobroma cacao]